MTAKTAQSQAAMVIVLKDVETIIMSLCLSWSRRSGVPYDDLLSTAYEEFVIAYNTHALRKSKFTTWLWNRLNWKLFEDAKHKYQAPRNATDIEVSELSDYRSVWDLREWFFSLSQDAQFMVRLAFLITEVRFLPGKTVKPRVVRAEMKRVLLNYFSWTVDRYNSTFKEVNIAVGDRV